jgi:hypothetical protein
LKLQWSKGSGVNPIVVPGYIGFGFPLREVECEMSEGSRHSSESGIDKKVWCRWLREITLSALGPLTLMSCSDEHAQYDKRLKQITSWSASAELILEARLENHVPQGFTDLAVKQCRKAISDLAKQLPVTSNYRDTQATIAKLNGLIDEAHGEIGQGQLERGRQHLAELRRYETEKSLAWGTGE